MKNNDRLYYKLKLLTCFSIKPNPSRGGDGKLRIFLKKMAELPEGNPFACSVFFAGWPKESRRLQVNFSYLSGCIHQVYFQTM